MVCAYHIYAKSSLRLYSMLDGRPSGVLVELFSVQGAPATSCPQPHRAPPRVPAAACPSTALAVVLERRKDAQDVEE